jgi:hypothetical protein
VTIDYWQRLSKDAEDTGVKRWRGKTKDFKSWILHVRKVEKVVPSRMAEPECGFDICVGRDWGLKGGTARLFGHAMWVKGTD